MSRMEIVAVTDEAIQKIKAMIVSGDLTTGSRLPPEKELSERLGLSRSSLREAVKALEVLRILDVRRGDGTYITSLEPPLLLEGISFIADILDDDSLFEALGVRRILESQATGIAAVNASPADIRDLEFEVDSTAGLTDVDDLIEHDVRFHARIVALAGNRYLKSLLDNLTTQTIRARIWRAVTDAGALERTLQEHRGIVEAIAARDINLAIALATSHVAGVEQWLRAARQPLFATTTEAE